MQKSHTLLCRHTHSDFIKPTTFCVLPGAEARARKTKQPFFIQANSNTRGMAGKRRGEEGGGDSARGLNGVCAPLCWNGLLWPRRQDDESGKPIGMPHWSPEPPTIQDLITLNRKIEMNRSRGENLSLRFQFLNDSMNDSFEGVDS